MGTKRKCGLGKNDEECIPRYLGSNAFSNFNVACVSDCVESRSNMLKRYVRSNRCPIRSKLTSKE